MLLALRAPRLKANCQELCLSLALNDQPVPRGHEHHLDLLGVIQHLMTILVAAVFVVTFIAQPFRIPSESMEPALLIGDFVLVDKVSFAPAGAWHWLLPYQQVRRGDVIVFRRTTQETEITPLGRDEYIVKRVIAVPGDRIRLQQGRVALNGAPLSEPYAMQLPSGPDAYRDEFPGEPYPDPGVEAAWWVQMHQLLRNGSLVVPENSYFVMGDNRNHSLDSRYWGFVDRRQIVGEALLVYFSVRTPSPDEPELQQHLPGNVGDRMGKTGGADSGFARWDRMLHVIR